MRSTRALSLGVVAGFCLSGAVVFAPHGADLLAQDPAAVAPATLKGTIRIDQPTFDFGKVDEGTQVVHEYEVKNAGNAPLKIQRLVSPCGCTAATTESDTIQPGTATKVRVSFNTSGFRGISEKNIQVYADDQDTPMSTLRLVGTVLESYSIVPASLQFGTLPVAKAGDESRTFEVSIRDGAKFKIAGVRSVSKVVAVEPVQAGADRGTYKVTLVKGIPIGPIRDRVVVEITDGTTTRSLNVPVIAQLEGPLRVTPSVVSFGLIEGKNKLERTLQVEATSDTPLTVTGVTSSMPALSATLKPIEAGKRYAVELSLDPAAVKKDLKASVTIETSNEEQHEVIVNVYGVIPPKV